MGERRLGSPAGRVVTTGPMGFGEALAALRSGGCVTRAGWSGRGQWIALQVPDDGSKMRKPYIYISPVDGELVPWIASQGDLLAEDWWPFRPPRVTEAL